MQFQPHGDFKIWIVDKTLYAELKGTWNEEAALQFEADFIKAGKPLGDQWAHLVYLNDWELCEASMFPIIERLVNWCLENGLKRAANVYPKSSLKESFINQMVVEQKGEFVRKVFDNDVDAAIWLTQEGYPSEGKGP